MGNLFSNQLSQSLDRTKMCEETTTKKDNVFLCEKCGIKSVSLEYLKFHLSHYHKSEKSFCCKKNQCADYYAFLMRQSCQKKYPCKYPDCKKVFESAAVRNRHSKSHLPEIFPCPQCNKTFESLKLLMHHDYNRHGNQKYYPCPFCSRLYLAPGGWEKHLKINHAPIYRQGIRFYDQKKFKVLRHLHIIFKEDNSLPGEVLEYLNGPPDAIPPPLDEIATAIGGEDWTP